MGIRENEKAAAATPTASPNRHQKHNADHTKSQPHFEGNGGRKLGVRAHFEPGARPFSKQSHSRQSGVLSHSARKGINKSALISPAAMLDRLGIRYHRASGRLTVYCPFHKGGKERNPSLSMNVKDGHYKCFACGEKGGDVIAFYRAVTGAGFMEALKVLGVHHG
jgi:hypothetical protein